MAAVAAEEEKQAVASTAAAAHRQPASDVAVRPAPTPADLLALIDVYSQPKVRRRSSKATRQHLKPAMDMNRACLVWVRSEETIEELAIG